MARRKKVLAGGFKRSKTGSIVRDQRTARVAKRKSSQKRRGTKVYRPPAAKSGLRKRGSRSY